MENSVRDYPVIFKAKPPHLVFVLIILIVMICLIHNGLEGQWRDALFQGIIILVIFEAWRHFIPQTLILTSSSFQLESKKRTKEWFFHEIESIRFDFQAVNAERNNGGAFIYRLRWVTHQGEHIIMNRYLSHLEFCRLMDALKTIHPAFYLSLEEQVERVHTMKSNLPFHHR